MGCSPKRPLWWDREVDKSGRIIRADVRAAAHKVWNQVCVNVRRILGDKSEAPELLEKAIESSSRYLDRYNIPPHDPSGLLLRAVDRLAHPLARRRGRVQAVGSTSELAEILKAPEWSEEADRRIFLERLVLGLKDQNRVVLRLRIEGYEWTEIADMLNLDPSVVRKRFWRDIRRAHLQLLRPDSGDTSSR
jgi:DNA-directed RNA polymerase specialized sigma24 family protein